MSEKIFFDGDEVAQSRNYLEKHQEQVNLNGTKSEEAIVNRSAIQRLELPLGEADFSNSQGDIRINNGDFHLALSYSDVDSDLVKRDLSTEVMADDYSLQANIIANHFGSEWRQLVNLTLEKDGVLAPIDLQKILPAGYRVLFNEQVRTNGSFLTAGSCFPTAKLILLSNNPVSMRSILTLLHEAGHAWDYKRLDENDKEAFFLQYDGFGRKKDANHIKRERNAFAYSLRKIKPFLDSTHSQEGPSFTKQDIKADIDCSIAINYQEIDEAWRMRGGMDHIAQDYFDDVADYNYWYGGRDSEEVGNNTEEE